jgi:GH35 family endo-1,4-beta-xylanase
MNFPPGRTCRYLCLTLALLFSARTAANAQSLVTNGDFTAPLPNTWVWSGKAKAEPVTVPARIDGDPKITSALRVELNKVDGAQPWDYRVVAPKTALPIKKRDLILVQFWARGDRKTRMNVVFQQAVQPFDKSIRQVAMIDPEWRRFTYYGPAKADYGPGQTNFEFQMGQGEGAIEIAGVHVEDLGAMDPSAAEAQYGAQTIDYYGSAPPDDSWIPAANERIEKIRKAPLTVRVLDKDGRPVPGATVTLHQTKSAFRFGTAINYWLLKEGPDGDAYRENLKRLFNTAVLENDMKWRATDGNPDTQKRARECLDWLHANGFEVRGHCLVWGGEKFYPERVQKLSADEARAEVEKRVTDTVSAFKNQFYVWDVVNEAGQQTQLWDRIGWDSFSNVYRLAKAADPQVLLAYNDYNIANEAPDNGALRKKVEARIQLLEDSGAPVDILGDQAHIGVPLTPIPRVLQIWDDWGKRFKKPIEITEFDVNVADDQIHEKYVRDFLTAAFSDPNIQSVVMWGFWEKAHWLGRSGALFRADWSPRPAELAYEDLVLNQWRTNQTLTTNQNGTIETRGFLGDYNVTVESGGQRVTAQLVLSKAGMGQEIRLP